MYHGPSPTPSTDDPYDLDTAPDEDPNLGAWVDDAPEIEFAGEPGLGDWVLEQSSHRARQPWAERAADAEHRAAMQRRVRFEIAVLRAGDRGEHVDLGHLWRSAAGS